MAANLKPVLHDCEDIVPPSQIGWGEGLWSGGHQMTEVSGACLSRGELALHEVHVRVTWLNDARLAPSASELWLTKTISNISRRFARAHGVGG